MTSNTVMDNRLLLSTNKTVLGSFVIMILFFPFFFFFEIFLTTPHYINDVKVSFKVSPLSATRRCRGVCKFEDDYTLFC